MMTHRHWWLQNLRLNHSRIQEFPGSLKWLWIHWNIMEQCVYVITNIVHVCVLISHQSCLPIPHAEKNGVIKYECTFIHEDKLWNKFCLIPEHDLLNAMTNIQHRKQTNPLRVPTGIQSVLYLRLCGSVKWLYLAEPRAGLVRSLPLLSFCNRTPTIFCVGFMHPLDLQIRVLLLSHRNREWEPDSVRFKGWEWVGTRINGYKQLFIFNASVWLWLTRREGEGVSWPLRSLAPPLSTLARLRN